MVSFSRCPLGSRMLLTLLLCLALYLPGVRGACHSPPRFSFAAPSEVVKDSYDVGTQVKYSCRPGYSLVPGKSPFVTCLQNSMWSEVPEFCVRKSCQVLDLQNGRIDVTDLQLGATANFSCNEGYRLIGTTSAHCVVVENGVDWDKEVPFCEAILCRPPPDIANGSHNGLSQEEFSFGSAVTYKCNPGLSLIGEASIHCTTKDNLNGEWSGSAPECKVVKCLEPDVKNGKKQSGFGPDYSYGNTVIFACDDGYTLNGSSIVKCEANNSWVPSLPTCLSIVHTAPTTSLPGGTKDTSGSAAKPTEETTKNPSGSAAKPTEETTKNPSGSAAKPTEETTKNPSGSAAKTTEETTKNLSESTLNTTLNGPKESPGKNMADQCRTCVKCYSYVGPRILQRQGPNTGTTIAIGKMTFILAVLINLFIRQ